MKIKTIKKLIIKFIALLLILSPIVSAQAVIVSDNYIIYRDVKHIFDGPVISSVSSSVSGVAVAITWTTDVSADSFVIYDTDNTFVTSKEQGTSIKNFTSHSVSLSGLAANTLYYYQVRSERINGGITTDSTTRSFITGSVGDEDGDEESGGGGGVLVIDKTDKIEPIIINVVVSTTTSKTATISWETDEEATSFVEYGPTIDYGSTQGQWEQTFNHSVVIEGLKPTTEYHFRVLSSDGWANVGYSNDGIFTTVFGMLGDNDIDKINNGLQLVISPSSPGSYVHINEDEIAYMLTNGNKLYNLVSDVGEWTNELINKEDMIEPMVDEWKEFYEISSYKAISNIRPPYYLSSDNGIGRVYTGDNDNLLRGFVRGKNGIYSLDLSYSPAAATSTIGFRCAK